MTQNHPSPAYAQGFEAGLVAARSLESNDIEMVSLARALSSLGKHAAAMDNHDEALHDSCMECGTMVLLARVVRFGDQIRAAEKRERNRG